MKRLGDAELEIMLVIWAAQGGVTSAYVQERMRGRRDWSLPAVVTALNRLVDKGFLSCEKQGRSNLYSPLISERDYKASESRGILDKLFGNSISGLVTSLYDGKAIGDKEISELRDFLDKLEDK